MEMNLTKKKLTSYVKTTLKKQDSIAQHAISVLEIAYTSLMNVQILPTATQISVTMGNATVARATQSTRSIAAQMPPQKRRLTQQLVALMANVSSPLLQLTLLTLSTLSILSQLTLTQ